MKGLQDKVALVTGGSSGIGQAIAIRLGEEGVAGRSWSPRTCPTSKPWIRCSTGCSANMGGWTS